MYRDAAARELVYLAFNGHVVAFFRDRHEVAWRHDLSAQNEISLHVDDDAVIVACVNELLALDPGSGAILWRTVLPFNMTTPTLMLVEGDAIFVSQGGEIACIGRDGTLRWSDPLNGTGYGPPTLAVRGRSVRLGAS